MLLDQHNGLVGCRQVAGAETSRLLRKRVAFDTCMSFMFAELVVSPRASCEPSRRPLRALAKSVRCHIAFPPFGWSLSTAMNLSRVGLEAERRGAVGDPGPKASKRCAAAEALPRILLGIFRISPRTDLSSVSQLGESSRSDQPWACTLHSIPHFYFKLCS